MFSPRLLLETEVIIIIYYLDFSNNRENIWSPSSSSKNDKNGEVGDQTHARNILPLDFAITEGQSDKFA